MQDWLLLKITYASKSTVLFNLVLDKKLGQVRIGKCSIEQLQTHNSVRQSSPQIYINILWHTKLTNDIIAFDVKNRDVAILAEKNWLTKNHLISILHDRVYRMIKLAEEIARSYRWSVIGLRHSTSFLATSKHQQMPCDKQLRLSANSQNISRHTHCSCGIAKFCNQSLLLCSSDVLVLSTDLVLVFI